MHHEEKNFALLMAAVLAILFTGSAMAAGYVEVNATVNVRSGPGLNYRDIGTVYQNNTLEYLNKTSVDDRGVAWFRVDYKGETGWVSSRYCELFGEVYVYGVNGQSYVRSYPSLNGKALDVLHEGESALFLGKTSTDERGVDWYKIEFGDVTGWISSRYTSFEENGGYDREVIADDGQSYIRDYPSLNGKKLVVFEKGDSAVYLEKSAKDDRGVTWYMVDYDGVIGWVSSRYTSVY